MKAHIDTAAGEIVLELFEDDAPGTVANFVGLARGTREWTDPETGQKVKRPYYDGLTFHRVIDNFMIQGGCPLGTGTGGPGYTIKDELGGRRQRHLRGSLSMAKTAARDSGGAQFFICHSPQPHLDRKHTVFGQVISGIEVVDKIRKGDKMARVWIEGVSEAIEMAKVETSPSNGRAEDRSRGVGAHAVCPKCGSNDIGSEKGAIAKGVGAVVGGVLGAAVGAALGLGSLGGQLATAAGSTAGASGAGSVRCCKRCGTRWRP